jgi:aminopeptidase N
MEYWFGPYPFYEDGFKMVEAPYKGESYQSAPAYGNHFDNGRMNLGKDKFSPLKLDPVIVKNVAKEWFGSSITTCGGHDAWFSNAIAGYAEELVMNDLYSKENGKEHYRLRVLSLGSDKANNGVLFNGGIEEKARGTYVKGWGVLRTLNAVMGEELFRKVMWEMNKGLGHLTVGASQIEQYVSTATGTDYSHFFRTYTEGYGIPVLEYNLQGTNLKFRLAKCEPGFEMPLKVYMPELKKINATTNWQNVKIHDDLQGYLNLDEAYLVRKLYVDMAD